MNDTIEELKLKRKLLKNETDEIIDKMEDIVDETQRVATIASNAEKILGDLDAEFEKSVNLHGKDLTFVFVATGLLSIKWLMLQAIMPLSFDIKYLPSSTEKRLNSTEMGEIDTKGKTLEEYKKTLNTVKKNHDKLLKKIEFCDDETKAKVDKAIVNNEKRQEELNKVISFISENEDVHAEIKKLEEKRNYYLQNCDGEKKRYKTVKEILTDPVPYDAMKIDSESVIIPVKLSGTNHHAYTLGHDPVLGWIFGTMNIMSSTISFNYPNFPVYWVKTGNKITGRCSWISFCMSCINSAKEDPTRIAASTLRQGLHFMSDKYGKTGLPLSFATRTPEEAQELIKAGWNSEELKKYIEKIEKIVKKDARITGIQFMLSFIINQIIYTIYLMMYDKKRDGSLELYKIKANHIIAISNTIATASNFVFVAVVNKLSALDIGGAIETIRRVINDNNYKRKIKEEFVQNNFLDLIRNEESEFNYLITDNIKLSEYEYR